MPEEKAPLIPIRKFARRVSLIMGQEISPHKIAENPSFIKRHNGRKGLVIDTEGIDMSRENLLEILFPKVKT